MRFRHLRGIIIALMATEGMLAVASCTSSKKEPEADFRVGPYYDYSANEVSITKEGYEVSSRSVVFGKDYYVVLGIGYNDEIMEAEDRWYDSFGKPEFKVLPTDNEGNICLEMIRNHYKDNPYGFEACAVNILEKMDPNFVDFSFSITVVILPNFSASFCILSLFVPSPLIFNFDFFYFA